MYPTIATSLAQFLFATFAAIAVVAALNFIAGKAKGNPLWKASDENGGTQAPSARRRSEQRAAGTFTAEPQTVDRNGIVARAGSVLAWIANPRCRWQSDAVAGRSAPLGRPASTFNPQQAWSPEPRCPDCASWDWPRKDYA